MAKILILIGGHFCTAPRPQKEAATLAAAGHTVIIRGVWFDPELAERDRLLLVNQPNNLCWQFEPVLDFRPHHRLTRSLVRLQARLAREQFRHFHRFSPMLLGYGAKAMLNVALQEQADLTIVHSEAGLWVADQLLQQGLKVGVDFEDWFSEDLMPQARLYRPVTHLKRLEARLAQNCTYCLTTSDALANRLAQVYQAPKPTVIYNVFPKSPLPAPHRAKSITQFPTIHWFSQTIGPGRGLETLFQSLPYIELPVEIHLRGYCSAQNQMWMNAQIPENWRDRVLIHPTVANAELPARIAEHDIGLALELPELPSRNLTITNKIFQYLQAGLAVVATDTAGQGEVFSYDSNIGHLIPPYNPIALADALNDLVQHPEKLQSAQQIAQRVSQECFCWEKHSDRLLEAVDRSLGAKQPIELIQVK